MLPQSVIFDLAIKAGCVPLEAESDHYTGSVDWISNAFVFAQPGAPAPVPETSRPGSAR